MRILSRMLLFLFSFPAALFAAEQFESSEAARKYLASRPSRDLISDTAKCERERIQAALITLGIEDATFFKPWKVMKNGDSPQKTIVLEGWGTLDHPSNPNLRFITVDTHQQTHKVSNFYTGWRRYPFFPQLVCASHARNQILRIDCFHDPSFLSNPDRERGSRIFISISGGVPRLIRVEDHSGKAIPNSYEYKHKILGNPEITSEENDIEAKLKSRAPEEILFALMFLSAKRSSDQNQAAQPQKSAWTRERVEKFLQQEEIDRLLKTHRVSNNVWIREAAGLIKE